MTRFAVVGSICLGSTGWIAACTTDEPRPIGAVQAELSPEERRERATLIRDVVAEEGITNGLLLAGIADAETTMAHCWSELTWACMGPTSPDCGGGPVVAGAGDGPCSLMQGGLGMFQFDAGTFDDTLRREGDRVLRLDGNIRAAVDFTIDMVIRSEFIEGVDTVSEAIDWMNAVRPWNEHYDPWVQTVTALYNGCHPSRCSVYSSRFDRYAGHTDDLLTEMGESFWYGDGSVTDEPCEPVPPEGAVIDDSDSCFRIGGGGSYFRTEETGYGEELRWTYATDHEAPVSWASWRLHFEERGNYLVEIHTDSSFADSRRAGYFVTHDGRTLEVDLDQTAADGFQRLGVFPFAAGEGQSIRLDDNTGEPYEDRLQLVYDAIRVTPVESGPPPDAGSGQPDAGHTGSENPDAGISSEPDAAPGTGADAGTMASPPDTKRRGGGCGVTAPGHAPGQLVTAALCALLLLAPRRRRQRR